MTPGQMQQVRTSIEAALQAFAHASHAQAAALLPGVLAHGKLYEAHVLAHVIQRFVADEGATIHLQGAPQHRLRAAPGLVDRGRYAYFDVHLPQGVDLELWTDVELVGLSPQLLGVPPLRPHASELDIVLIDGGLDGRPNPAQVHYGAECKHRPFSKSFLREILGVRRQLSFYQQVMQPTAFQVWPAPEVPLDPPSVLGLFCTGQNVVHYAAPASAFAIRMDHKPI